MACKECMCQLCGDECECVNCTSDQCDCGHKKSEDKKSGDKGNSLLPTYRVYDNGSPEALLTAKWVQRLARKNPKALLLEPRHIYDEALVGITNEPEDHWTRDSGVYVAVYDEDKCIDVVMSWLDCDDQEAQEWLSFNTYGAWAGEGTPTFRSIEGEANVYRS